MNGAAAKASRREIRRAFGDRAIAEVETIAGDLRQEVGNLALAQLEDRARLKRLLVMVETFQGCGFWGRLRWLLRGQ